MREPPETAPEPRVKAFDVSIVGELNLDLILYGLPAEIPPERELLASGFFQTLGSSSGIMAHNLARLGSRVHFSGLVGNDAMGHVCRQFLAEAGVDTSSMACVASGTSTGVTVILPLPDGVNRRMVTYLGAMSELTYDRLDLDRLATARHFHLSSLFLQRGLAPDVAKLFAEMQRRGLTTSLDTNDDPDDQWGDDFRRALPHLDILFCNERELRRMTRETGPERGLELLAKQVPMLILKRGREGSCGVAAGTRVESPAISVTDAVDSVGAGDSFNAGFLYCYLRDRDLARALHCGNVAGALSVTRAGGIEAFRQHDYCREFLNRHLLAGSDTSKR